jgi:hypothetical protein
MEIDKKHRGAKAELLACVWLLSKGYEVFRNVSQHGVADLVATRGDEVLKLDVKTINGASVPRLTASQINEGVVGVYVHNDGHCDLDLTPIAKFSPGDYACTQCGEIFTRAKEAHRFCSSRCRLASFNLTRKAHGLPYATWVDNADKLPGPSPRIP